MCVKEDGRTKVAAQRGQEMPHGVKLREAPPRDSAPSADVASTCNVYTTEAGRGVWGASWRLEVTCGFGIPPGRLCSSWIRV